MQLTTRQIYAAHPVLVALYRRTDLPARAAFAVMKTARAVEGVYMELDAVRMKRLREFAELDDDGKIVTEKDGDEVVFRSDEARAAWEAEWSEMEGESAAVAVHQVDIEAFGDAAVSGAELARIDFMIRD